LNSSLRAFSLGSRKAIAKDDFSGAKWLSKVVYVLSSQGRDVYSSMTRISVASLRVSNPHIKVILVCDALTGDLLQTTEDPLTSEVDTTIVVETPSGNSGFRNRFVKTQLPSIMPGKFLFLDGDTFVRGSLDSVFALECDIAGARNHSQARLEDQIWSEDSKVLEKMCWQVSDEVYINGGVLFVNDSDGARRVFQTWFELWSEVAEAEGYYRDQPALNTAIFRTKPNLMVIDDKYNAQFVANFSVAESALIWHYYSSAELTKMTVFDVLLTEVFKKEKVSRRKIRAVVNQSHPWRQEGLVDRLAVRNLRQRKEINSGWGAAWLRREFWTYIRKTYLYGNRM